MTYLVAVCGVLVQHYYRVRFSCVPVRRLVVTFQRWGYVAGLLVPGVLLQLGALLQLEEAGLRDREWL